ncbi:hypothetical protein, partial [Klebsiella pneumoniae]|uniref:hypothetical protein n=1 Tax=Klebsiella pneumoniae TaxID=573 RepID=UPI003F825A22
VHRPFLPEFCMLAPPSLSVHGVLVSPAQPLGHDYDKHNPSCCPGDGRAFRNKFFPAIPLPLH